MQVTTRGFVNRPIGPQSRFFSPLSLLFSLPVSYAQTFRSPAAVLYGWIGDSKVDLPSTRPFIFCISSAPAEKILEIASSLRK